MPIDFSAMLGDDDEKVVNPRDIFITLDRDPSFSFPRDIQTEVINQWFDVRDNRDNVIKLNVGSGKTLVGLLLLQSSINEGKGPSLYVAPDKQLASQVIQEAKSLGIEVTDDPRDADYLAGEKICVINVYKLFNGKSVFGVGASKINIGALIIDDAHACVSTITEQFRIELPHTHDAYQKIFAILQEDLKGYNHARYLDIESGDPRAHMEVPFWSWDQNQSDVLGVLHEHRNDDQLQFTFPLLNEILPQCRCVVGGQHLEIEPYFPATDLIQSFRRATRRIYMTATLADDSVLTTHFGADPQNLLKPIVPTSSQSMGERMILMPQELNSDLAFDEIKLLLSELASNTNVVVITPSISAAELWKDVANQILVGDSVIPGIDKLRAGHVGLTVLVNRYDGIDLPGDACRVLVISDLPEVSSYVDLVDSEVLSGTSMNLQRQVERIEQGMGRGVRSNEDYCVVMLLGSRLTSRIRSPEGQSMLTPATKAQLDLSRKIASRIGTPTPSEIKDVILQCLNRDPDWIRISKKILVGLQPDDELRLDEGKLAIRAAFDCARANQHHDGLSHLDKAIDNATDDHIKAWLLARKAAFQHPIDPGGAQKSLGAAHKLEPGVGKPMHGTSYKQLSPSTGHQSAQLISNHNARFLDGTQMKLYCDALCADLQFCPETSEKFEAAINDLAWYLGINSQRPEKDYKEGPDNLWALADGSFLVIECKNGVTSESGISKKDTGQLGQSVAWFNHLYPSSAFTPVIVHPQCVLDQGASLIEGMRTIDEECLTKLKENLRNFSRQLVDPSVSGNVAEVAKRLTQLSLNAEAIIEAYSKPVRSR